MAETTNQVDAHGDLGEVRSPGRCGKTQAGLLRGLDLSVPLISQPLFSFSSHTVTINIMFCPTSGCRKRPGFKSAADHVPYDIWQSQGYLLTTEGNVIHYGFIEKFIEELGQDYNIQEIAFDRWGAVQMVQNLEGLGFTVVPFGQGFKDMSPPTKELMKLALEKRIAHGGHPVLSWMMDNIHIRTDQRGILNRIRRNQQRRSMVRWPSLWLWIGASGTKE